MKGEVLITAADMGTADCGRLELGLAVRDSGKDVWQPQEVAPLPLASILVVPRGVLYWDQWRLDQKPERLNSLKRFAYMLGLRAVPQTLCEEPILPDHLPERSREDATLFIERYLRREGSSFRRARTKMGFGYLPPTDSSTLGWLQRYLMEHMGL